MMIRVSSICTATAIIPPLRGMRYSTFARNLAVVVSARKCRPHARPVDAEVNGVVVEEKERDEVEPAHAFRQRILERALDPHRVLHGDGRRRR